MKKDIVATISGGISTESWERYYNQLWMALKDQYDYYILEQLYKELQSSELISLKNVIMERKSQENNK